MDHPEPSDCSKRNPFHYLRVAYLYTMNPYDKSIWHCMRNPFFWIFFLIKIFPWYSVQAYFFCFVFLCIDKDDEWQLI